MILAADTNPRAGGYRELLVIAIPLIISTSATSLMHVVDRVFLAWYSPDCLAASIPGGVVSYVVISLFVGTAGYVNAFVAQYDGAGRPRRIGTAVWQGLYFSMLAAVLMVCFSFTAKPLFRLVGHPPAVQAEEVRYFRILAVGGGGPVFAACLEGFFGGRGRTLVVMWANAGAAVLNATLNYLLIFGKCGFPEWGIWGAGLATVTATWAKVVFYAALFLGPRNRRSYATLRGWRMDPKLFGRLLAFGLPSGLQYMADVAAFAVFVLLVGRLGTIELAATNAAFTINTLVFMPMVGTGIATTVLVGRYVGAGRPDLAAARTTASARLTLLYMGGFSLALALWPHFFLRAFMPAEQRSQHEAIAQIARYLLYFVAAYSIPDAANVVYSAALKGAGDTRYVLWILAGVSVTVLILPVYVACVVLGGSIYVAWTFMALYVTALGAAYYLRYRAGHWRRMRVIEYVPRTRPTFIEGPVSEI